MLNGREGSGNGNWHGVIREREHEWELLHHNWTEWESKPIKPIPAHFYTVRLSCGKLAKPKTVQ